jgi:cytochrome c553
MKKIILFIVLMISFNSCKEKAKEEDITSKTSVETEELVMYEMSEMALLMEKMFVENERLKEKIEKGEVLGEFNQEYLNIHSAVLTDPGVRNESFNSFSKALLVNQKAVFTVEGEEVKIQFNRMVQTCVACHETTCMGPIPRIKKLIIN